MCTRVNQVEVNSQSHHRLHILLPTSWWCHIQAAGQIPAIPHLQLEAQQQQTGLLMSYCEQPVSSSEAKLLISLMCTAIVSSASFIWNSGSRLALRSIPLAHFPDNCRIYGPPHHMYNIISRVSIFQCAVLCKRIGIVAMMAWYGITWIPGRKLLHFIPFYSYHCNCQTFLHYLGFHDCSCSNQQLVDG